MAARSLLLSALAAASVALFPTASAFVVNDVSSPYSNCDGGSWNVDFYGDFKGKLWDRYDALGESYVSASSRIDVFVKGGKATIPNGWVQTTSYAPSAGSYYVAWNNADSFLNLANLVPADRGTPVAQVSYVIRRAVRSDAGTQLTGSYYTSPFVSGATPNPIDRGSLNLKFDTSNVYQDRECFNIYPRWCGDGVRDPEERCDPNDASRSGLSAGETCAPTTCTPVSITSDTSCSSASVSPSSVLVGQSSTLTCAAASPNAATNYYMECGNGQNQSGTSNSMSCTYSSTGSYAPRCRVDNEGTFKPACTSSVTVTSSGASVACQSLSASPSSSVGGSLTSTVTCASTDASRTTRYLIDCGNGQTFDSASPTATCTYATTGNWNATCRVNTETSTVPACSQPISVTTGGGGSSAQCQSLTLSSSSSTVGSLTTTLTCGSNNPPVANKYVLDCWNGTSFTGSSNTATCTYGLGTFTAKCTVNEESSPTAACLKTVTVTNPGGGGGRTYCGDGSIQTPNSNGEYETCDQGAFNGAPGSSCSASCTSPGGGGGGGGGGYCGDGVIQRPNSDGTYESCDAGTNNGRAGYACSTSCTIGSTNPGYGPNEIRLTTTNPGSRGSMAVSSYRAIVGNGVRVFGDGDSLSFFSTYPILISGKDTYVTNASPVITGTSVSRTITESELCVGPSGSVMQIGTSSLDASGSVVWTYHGVPCRSSYALWSGSQLSAFKGNSAPLSSAETYRDTASGEFYVGIRFLQEDLTVRVSKPAVSNTVGGNAYLSRATGYDVNTIAGTFLENLRKGNFTTTSIVSGNLGNGRNLSSATATATMSKDPNQAQLGSLDTVASGDYSGNLEVRTEADFDTLPKMGDDERVRVLSSGELEIGTHTTPVSLSKVRTIVVENGTLRISGNLSYSDPNASYAFVVKNGSIVIAPEVTNVAGVFLVMRGDIRGVGIKTPNRLAIDGNLYGNAAPLVDERTYVRGTIFSSALTTGVTINYSSRAIRNPPPILTQFIEQYSLNRVAK